MPVVTFSFVTIVVTLPVVGSDLCSIVLLVVLTTPSLFVVLVLIVVTPVVGFEVTSWVLLLVNPLTVLSVWVVDVVTPFVTLLLKVVLLEFIIY